MICLEAKTIAARPAPRPARARERLPAACAQLACCHLCEHHCGVNRLAGEKGPCRAGPWPFFFSAQIEVSDELELSPTFAIAFSGCDLRCDFCITGASSWNPAAGKPFEARAMATAARQALAEGARTIMVLGGEPTVFLPSALELVAELPAAAKLAWKTNAHGSRQSRELLAGLFDVWVADFKFGNSSCAERLAGVKNYVAPVQENLLWAASQSDLIVRHLVMPGHVDCCWAPVAAWLGEHLPSVKVNLRSGFWPAWHAARHLEFRQPVSARETRRANDIARSFGLVLVE
jgi:putative pyruvate formate lyase activating enzyme